MGRGDYLLATLHNSWMTQPTRSQRTALRVMRLRKAYGATIALDEVSFAVMPGEVVGLLGPNGAGKTTTINMILGVLEPTSGSVRIDEIDLARDRARTHQFRGRLCRVAGEFHGQ